MGKGKVARRQWQEAQAAVHDERAEYAQGAGEDLPLGTYAALTGGYLAAVGGFAAVAARSGVRLPDSVPAGDIALLGAATFTLSRLVSRDRVTTFMRAPFTRYVAPAGGPEVEEEPRERGARKGIGDLLTCPWCTAQWVGTGLACAYLVSPRLVRFVGAASAALTVSDGLNLACSRATG